LLQDMGYGKVRHYVGGLADWIKHGNILEQGTQDIKIEHKKSGSKKSVQNHIKSPTESLLQIVEKTSFGALFGIWLGISILCGVIYWIWGVIFDPCLKIHGVPLASNMESLGTAVYFSFVTATSIGFGDILPIGMARFIAVAEGIAGLLIFGCVISKLVSHRQDLLIEEIHITTFEERLGRVRLNLHMVLTELQQLAAECSKDICIPRRITPRLESTSMVLVGELRSIHDLLYQPQRTPDESIMEALLANLTAILRELDDIFKNLPENIIVSRILSESLRIIRSLSDGICSECVPREYAPELKVWMDRINELASGLEVVRN